MNRFRKIKIFLMILIVHGITLCTIHAQDAAPVDASNFYRTLSLGLNNSKYRDFATSPLFYTGMGISVQSSWLKKSDKRERALDMGIAYSSVSAMIPESDYLQPSTAGSFIQLNLRYLRLWELKKLSNQRNNIKVGGNVLTTLNIRPNSALFNNAFGIENITNIMASGQIIRDISRKIPRQLNLGLIKIKMNPRKQQFRFQLNSGLLNFNYRPGYAYSYTDELMGLETQAWVLADYKLSVNGWRFNTELEFIRYLPNGNARSWSYVWDAAHVPGRFEPFQMAGHQIRYTYYFHTKKR